MVLNYLHQAEKNLHKYLEEDDVPQELVESMEMLVNAFTLIENPDEQVHICPSCESVFFEETVSGGWKCLGCDRILIGKAGKED